MRSSMACSSSVAAAAILFPNSSVSSGSPLSRFAASGSPSSSLAASSRVQRSDSAAIRTAPAASVDGDVRRGLSVRPGVEQRQDRTDEAAGRQAGQRLDGVGPHALVGRMGKAVEQPDVAPAAERRLDHQHAPDDPPVAGRQCRRQHLDQLGGSQLRRRCRSRAPRPAHAGCGAPAGTVGRRWSSRTRRARLRPDRRRAPGWRHAPPPAGATSAGAPLHPMAALPKRPSASAAACRASADAVLQAAGDGPDARGLGSGGTGDIRFASSSPRQAGSAGRRHRRLTCGSGWFSSCQDVGAGKQPAAVALPADVGRRRRDRHRADGGCAAGSAGSPRRRRSRHAANSTARPMATSRVVRGSAIDCAARSARCRTARCRPGRSRLPPACGPVPARGREWRRSSAS